MIKKYGGYLIKSPFFGDVKDTLSSSLLVKWGFIN